MSALNPRVDIVIPACNAAEAIGDAIASVQAQTFTDFRIIMINDGSLDGTGEILQRLHASDRRIQVFNQANGGIVAARNAGLRVSTAEFLAVQDADDLSDPDRLLLEVDHLDRSPSCSAVSGSARHIDGVGEATGGCSTMPPLEAAGASWVPAREPYLLPFGLSPRSALDQVGRYRHVDFTKDTDLCWKLSRIGWLSNVPEVVGSYRYHPDSASGGGSLVNIRILAANNQLAAVSAARWAHGKLDLEFAQARLHRYREAGTLTGIFGCRVQPRLDPGPPVQDRVGLDAAVERRAEHSALLGGLRFIKQSYDERPALSLRRLYTVMGARLMRRPIPVGTRASTSISRPGKCLRSVLGRDADENSRAAAQTLGMIGKGYPCRQ